MGLGRVHEVLARLGLQPPAGRVVIVGGTNGKGSTITLLHDFLRAAGGNPGLYTSPHLVRYNERIRIAGQPVTDATLIAAFGRVEEARRTVPLTYFEFGTLAAMACCADLGCDAWLLEVGLGGRLDAVNALDADLALITTIGLDHQEWLGTTLEEIAAEKAGIMRTGRPVLYGDAPVPAAIRAEAERKAARLQTYGTDFSYRRDASSSGWSWHAGSQRIDGLRAPAQWTAAQYRNAALAVAAFATMSPPGLPTAAFLNPVLLQPGPPGRFQIVRREHEWILDVAHNPQAAQVLREQLTRLGPPAAGAAAVTVVVAMLADKAVAEFVMALAGVAGSWIISGVDDPRASSEDLMRAAINAAGLEPVAWEPLPSAALELARKRTPPGGRIIVCGSFRLVAPALEWLGLY